MTPGSMTTPDTSINPWMIVATVMLVAILEVLDSTIINVALPAMMPSLGANQEQITWVLTSYVVAGAMMLPLTGYLSNRIGQKRLLLIDITGFMISSFLCGTAQGLTMMVILRLCQGAFGAALIPISQAVLRQNFPPEEQGKMMAIWGLGIMVAPVLGPTIGGFITEHTSWRWVFYINIPVCLIGLLMTSIYIKDTVKKPQKIDCLGVLLMFTGIGALQLFLDQGNSHNWFDSNTIILLLVVSIIGIILFIKRSVAQKNPVIHLPIFKDRNFSLCTLMLAIFAGCVFAVITLEPILLERIYGYTALLAGLTMSPVGIASAMTMVLTAVLMKKVSVKLLLTVGLLLSAGGIFYISTLDLSTSQHQFIIGNGIIGLGMGFFMVPLTTYSLMTINPAAFTEAAGLFAYGRMLGTSIGISLTMTLVTRETQINWNRFGGYITRFNSNLTPWLHAHGVNLQDPRAYTLLGISIQRHATMVAFIDGFLLIAIILLFMLILIACLKSVDMKNVGHHGH